MANIRFLDQVSLASFQDSSTEGGNTGSLLITASAVLNDITFTKGDGSTFVVTVDTGSGGGGSVDTGSLVTTGSFSNPILTFTKGDASTFDLNISAITSSLIQTGSVSGNTLTFTKGNGDTFNLEIVSASYASTASYVENAQTASNTPNAVTTGSVSNNIITLTKGDGSTFDLTVDTGSGGGGSTDTGSLLTTASAANNVITFTKGDASTFDITVDTGSGGDVSYDGDRIVSQDLFPTMFSASFNAGTTGSVTDFLNAVFFPNNAPVITANTFSIDEFEPSGSTVGTVTATDPEGQSLTFTTQSSYTDDLFRINSSSGVITANALVTSSINTDTSQGYSSSLFPITVTDSFGSETDDNVYIRVIANQAPVFREDSVGGNIITTFTSSLNENSNSGSKGQIYYTDTESDTITIGTGSGVLPSGSFELQISGTFVRLVQTTGSLDYEGTNEFTYVLTASDEHYPSQDDNSITFLPSIIAVVDNVAPTVNNQTLTGVTESSAGLTEAGTISVTEPEGDVVTFTNFNLISLALDGTPVATGSYSGTSQSDPTEDAFEVTSAGVVRRKSSVYINSDLINSYVYRVSVRDNFNETTSSGEITIPIGDDAPPSVNGVQAFYLIESALAGDNIYDSTNGRSGTVAQFTSNQSVTWTVSSSNDFTVNANGYLSSSQDISGSGIVSGNTISGEITASNSFGTTNQTTFTVNITENYPATASFTNQSGDWNTNEATSSVNLVSVTITDPESDTPYSMSLSGAGASSLVAVPQNVNSSSYEIRATEDLSSGDYAYTASVVDSFNKSQSYERTITIAQAGAGTLTTNGTFYVIESAVSGNLIYISGSGYSGTQADLGVSYSPNYGSQVVQSFTSSNAQISVTTAGALSLDQNISSSGTGSGDTITSDITFRDQYDNIGSGSVTINVTLNVAPAVTLNENSAVLQVGSSISGSVVASITGSDTQGLDNIISASLSGADAGKFEIQNASAESTTRRYEIQPTASLEAATYSITASVTDSFGKVGSASLDFTVADEPSLWYAYLAEVGVYATDAASSLSSYGDGNDDGVIDANFPFYNIANGDLGDSVLTSSALSGISAQYSYLVASGSILTGSNTSTILSNLDQTIGQQSSTGLLLVFPSSSDFGSLPTTMANAIGGSTTGEYVMWGDAVGTGIVDGVRTSLVRYFDFTGSASYPNSGESKFGVIFTTGEGNSDLTYFYMASSGSAPSSTH